MSRSWMPFYFGDYLRDTGHLTALQHGGYVLLIAYCWQHGKLPDSDKERKNLSKFSHIQWKKYGPTLLKFFNEDGTHKRITREIERAEKLSINRKITGAKGGFHSAIARAKAQPNGSNYSKQLVPPNPSNRIHNHKVSKKEPSEKGDLVPSPALLKTCKTKGWGE